MQLPRSRSKKPSEIWNDFYEEPGRERIYRWTARRFKKNQRALFNHARLYLINKEVLSSLGEHFNVIFIITIGISILVTILCVLNNITFHIPGVFYLTIFSLSVSFLIDADFTRREMALIQHAELRASCVGTFLASKSWHKLLKVQDAYYHSVTNHLVRIIIHINEYLQTSNTKRRQFISAIIYEDLNDISVLMEKYGVDETGVKMDTHTPIIWYFASKICTIFERLKVYREYRSPLTQRSFTKVLSFFLPILFAPWFVHMSTGSGNTWRWLAVMYNALFTFILNGQTFITDRLFDPFLALSSDHIDLSRTFSWIDNAILKIENRTYVPVTRIPPVPCGKINYETSPDVQETVLPDLLDAEPFKVEVKSVNVRGRTYILMEIVKPPQERSPENPQYKPTV